MSEKFDANAPNLLPLDCVGICWFLLVTALVLMGCVAILVFEGLPLLATLGLGATMVIVAIVDARRMIIPDILSLPAIPAGLLVSGMLVNPVEQSFVAPDHLVGAVFGALSLYLVRLSYIRLRGIEGLGMGDIKLAAVAGAWTGFDGFPLALLMAAVGALVYVAAVQFIQKQALSRTSKISFGTFFAPSIWCIWVWQGMSGDCLASALRF